jgi:Family of unknown function (DUF5706)
MLNQEAELNGEPVYSINKIDFLWKVIQRFDFYINSTNTKASAIIAFNAFIGGSIILKTSDLLPSIEAHHYLIVASSISLFTAAIASLVIFGATFLVISPFLKSSQSESEKLSNIFFAHVAKRENPIEFYGQIQSSNDDQLCQDLSIQAYSLAQGLDKKFRKMQIVFRVTIFFQLPACSFVILVKLYTLLFLSPLMSKSIILL